MRARLLFLILLEGELRKLLKRQTLCKALLKRLMWKLGVLLYGIRLKKELMRLNQLGLKFSFYYLSSFSIPISNDTRCIYVSSEYHFVF